MCIKINKVGKQEVGIWWVQKRFPRYGDSYFLFADFVDFYTHWTYMLIFRHIFLSNYWWQKSDVWSQASYRYAILWVAFLNPSDSYFLFADLFDFYTYLTYMLIFRHIFLGKYWWQKSDISSQASYRYPICGNRFFTYMKLVTKYQIPVINICWEKWDEKCEYMLNV
jgi:hypothetical protein